MGGAPRRLLPLTLVVAVLLALGAGEAHGAWQERSDSSGSLPSVDSDGAAVDVVFVGGRYLPTQSGRAAGADASCTMTVTRYPGLEFIHMIEGLISPAFAAFIGCGPGGFSGDRWIPEVDRHAERYARDYVERVLAPEVSIGTSPPANVLVGLPTWFWLDGWDGSTRTTTVTAPWGDSLELHLTVRDVTWDFGDGAPVQTGGAGQAYPAESDVQHVYTNASTSRSDPEATYPVAAALHIDVVYFYDTHGPITVDPIELTIDHALEVGQLQAVLSW